MRVVLDNGTSIELGDTEATPTIGITDYSRRVTDDYGVTTVVERAFSRRMSVKLALPFDSAASVQQRLASLRATSALWVADEQLAWLSVRGFYKDFDLDHAVPPLSYCMLSVEGLAETATVADTGLDPATVGASTLQLLQPVTIVDANLVSSNVPENDAAEWSAQTTYPAGARVIRAATHRIYESAIAGNIGNDPAGASGLWIDVGPTKRWAMFDQALGTSTTATSSVAVTIDAPAIQAVALLDVVATNVRVQATGYDRTIAAGAGAITFLDLPAGITRVTVTTTGSNVAIGTLLVGKLVGLGVTEASPTAGITDYSRKDVDDFGAVTIVERAWSKRMTAKALIRTDAVDVVANRIATVRAQPSLWIGQAGLDSLIVYGFFKDFSIEVDANVSKLSLSIEGLSKAAPIARGTISLVPRGRFSLGASYGEGDVVQYQGSSWVYINTAASAGNVPPTLPTEEDAFWRIFARAGDDGSDGNSAPLLRTQWSIDGVTGWHDNFMGADVYARQSNNGGATYGPAYRAVGETGDGPSNVYRRSATVPATPATNTGNPPAGWSDGPPAGTEILWLSTADFRGAAQITPWSAPQRITGDPGEVGSGSWTHIANSPTTIVTPTSARSTVSGTWGTDASQSKEGYTRGAAVDFVLPIATGSNRHAMAGLTAHPQSGLSFQRISFAIYRAPDGYMDIRIDGNTYTSVSLPDAAKPVACRVEFDGVDTVRWFIAGAQIPLTFNWPYPDSPLYFASAFSGTDGQVNSIAFAAIGARGRNGSDGLPGKVGADGRTERTHYAYANAPNGSVDFAVGAPDGRAYVGVYVDFNAADSTDPAAYVWSPSKGPASFGLAARGDVALASNSLIKTGFAAWGGGGGFSTEGWQNGAQTSFKLATVDTIAGLNADPTSNDSFETIDYAFHCSGDGNTYIYESGQPIVGLVGGNDATRTLQIVYDNATVVYLVNGAVIRRRAAPANLTLYFDAAIAGVPGQRITDISFVAAGTAGTDGTDGNNGADGFSVSLSAYVMKVQLTAAGMAKSGELPQYVNVRVLRGAVDVTAACAFALTASASLGASISGNNVALTGASADGTIDIAASYAGITLQPQRVKVATIRDNAAPSSVGVSSGPNDATINSSSYTDGYSAKSVVLQPNANGVVRFYGSGSYYAAPKTNINTSITLAGKSQYRVVGNTAWLDGGAEVAGSQAAYRPADGPDPGGISITHVISGLTPLTNYEFRLIYRITQISNMEATGIQGGTMTAEQP